jgi:hypothetical protein
VSSFTINQRESREVDWEILPPETKQKRKSLEPLFKWLAIIMDGLFRAPGTKFRFGLNPLIDFVPVVGDVSAAFVSFSVLIYAITRGLPKILIARMALNILINELVGIVPVLGSAFSPFGSEQTNAITICSSATLGSGISLAKATGFSSALFSAWSSQQFSQD